MGDTTTHDRLVREVAVGAHAAVVFVNYDRSPEAHYPVAIEEDYAVTKYVAEHPREFNIDAAGLAIAGDSVGGNMTAVVSLLAKSARVRPVRDEKTISLEDAHYKLSYLPAHMGGFKDRGAIKENAPADIVVYDLDKLEALPSEVPEDLPGGEWRRIQKSKGYNWILVNGQITFEDGEPTGAWPGKFLRNGRG